MLTFALSGQSNALSHASGGDFTISSLVKVWNNADNLDTLDGLGDGWVTPDRNAPPFVSGWNNHGVHAASRIAEQTGQQVRLVKVARGGADIADWYCNSARQALLLRLTAVLGAAGVTALDGFWFDQGQADEATTESIYSARYNAMIDCLEDDGYLTSSTPVVLVEQPNTYPNANLFLNNIAAAGGRTMIVPCARMNRQTSSPNHWTAPELIRIGDVIAGMQMLLAA